MLDLRVGYDLDVQITEVLACAEFYKSFVTPVMDERLPHRNRIPFPQEGSAWASERLLIDEASKSDLLKADSWASLFKVLLSDDLFNSSYSVDQKVYDKSFKDTLGRMVLNPGYYRRIGQIDDISSAGLRGWAIDPEDTDTSLSVELWLDGHFIGATETKLFRRDVQDLYGGSGNVGFFIAYNRGWPQGRPYSLELKDQATGKLLARLERPGEPRRADRSSGLQDDLANVRRLLASIEQRLKDEELALANSLERYDLYYDQVYREKNLSCGLQRSDLSVHAIVELGEASHLQVERAFLSLIGSGIGQADRFTIVTRDRSQVNVLRDLVARLAWTEGAPSLPRVEDFCCDSLTLALKRAEDAQVVVFAPGIGFLAEGGLSRLVAPFAGSDVKMTYGDDDALEPSAHGLISKRHIDPRLKPGFDPDLLMQTPYLGPCLAVRGELLAELGAEATDIALALQALVLKRGLDSQDIVHVARVIFTRFQADLSTPLAPLWRSHVAPLLEEGVSIEAWTDTLGVELQQASRIRRSVRTKAAILIPTKNGLDLLKPCVDSVLRSLADNQTEAEIIIINHESDDPGVLTYMADLAARGQARILDYEGPFNWALMNNLGAHETDAEVLVFLNNDTLIISPDWLDRLSSQAIRPEVGVVGARLLYQNGTIQHAGFVWRDHNQGFLIHEGVGVPGYEGGYLGRHALTHAAIAVTGACMAVSAATFKALGGFDAASFPVECNDVDLCLRAWDRGYRVLYEPSATLYHLESISRGYSREAEQLRLATAANVVMLERWGPLDRCDRFFNAHFSREGWPFERLRPPH